MRDREFCYVIKVFEAQWDNLHDESVKPWRTSLSQNWCCPPAD